MEHTFGDLEEEKLRPAFEDEFLDLVDYVGVLEFLELAGKELTLDESA